jgi:hypothetical protein
MEEERAPAPSQSDVAAPAEQPLYGFACFDFLLFDPFSRDLE